MANKMTIIENELDYETYVALRKAVGWNNFCREQGIPVGGGSVYSLFRKREKSVFMLSKALS